MKKFPIVRHMEFKGVPIAIETDQGQFRHWYDPKKDEHGKTKMLYPYGYFKGTLGLDGDEVDVFVGPDDSERVFVITQMERPDFESVDEQKVMVGFRDPVNAKTAYLQHYNNARFFGTIKEMTLDELKSKMKSSKGKLLKSNLLKKEESVRITEDNMLYLNLNKAMSPVALKPGSEIKDSEGVVPKESKAFREKKMDLKKKFKSKDQRAYMHAAADRGEISEDVVDEFEEKTPEDADLPKDVDTKKSLSEAMAHLEAATKSLKNRPDPVEVPADPVDDGVLVKALKAAAASGLSRRERLNMAYRAGIHYGRKSNTPFNEEPVVLDHSSLNLEVAKARPLHEPPAAPVHRVPTPNPMAGRPYEKAPEYVRPSTHDQEAKPIWRR